MGDKIYPIGIQNFEKIRNEGYYYVDKTRLISELLKKSTANVTLITRPRRFPQPSAPFREKPADFHAGSLFPREKGVVRGASNGAAGKELDTPPCVTS